MTGTTITVKNGTTIVHSNTAGVSSVDGFTGAVSLNGIYVPTFTPEAYGAKADGASDDSAAINAAFAAANTAGGGLIYFRRGKTYAVASKITLPVNTPVHLSMGTGSKIVATAAMTAVIEKPSGGLATGSVLENVTIDGGLLATRGLDIQQAQALRIKNPSISRLATGGVGVDFGRTGQQCYEIEWTGGRLTGRAGGDGGTSADLPTYGIQCGPSGVTDNTFDDIKVVNFQTGVYEQGQADVWTRVHIYNYPFATTSGGTDWSAGSIGALVPGYHNRFSHCYFDTLQTGIRITGSFVRVSDCEFLWPSTHVPAYAPVGVDIQAAGTSVIGCAWYPGNPGPQVVTGVQSTATAWRPVVIGNQFGGGASGYPAGGPLSVPAAVGGTVKGNHWDGGPIDDTTNNRTSSAIDLDRGNDTDIILRWRGTNPAQFLAVGSGASGYIRMYNESNGGWQVGGTGGTFGVMGAAPIARRANTYDTRTILEQFGFVDVGTALPYRGGVGARGAAATLTTQAPEIELMDATSGAFTITLPNTTTPGICFTFKKTDNSANAVTIAASGTTALIDASATYVLTAQYKYVRVVSTATSGRWYIIAAN